MTFRNDNPGQVMKVTAAAGWSQDRFRRRQLPPIAESTDKPEGSLP